MSGDSSKGQPATENPAPEIPASASVASHDRAELLVRARSFLTSPQVRLQDSDAKRAFLAEKGLTPSEVDQLLRELPPSIPPRTYPAPPPSNLPNLLAGVARILTWLTGTSAIVLFVYYRYLLPRLAQSYQARLSLRNHQSALVSRLTDSISALKAAQAISYEDLPRTSPIYEDSKYAQCHSINDLLSRAGDSREDSAQSGTEIPDITILRCALEELGRSEADGITTENLFRHLEDKLQWLNREEGMARQSSLWDHLNSCPLFVSSEPKLDASGVLPPNHQPQLHWKYVPPPPPGTPPLLASLAGLKAALPRCRDSGATSGGLDLVSTVSAKQRTLQILSDFTGYITTQTYSLGLPSIRGADRGSSNLNPVEEELRREIRALKGLVLNRRSFLPYGAGASGLSNETPRASET